MKYEIYINSRMASRTANSAGTKKRLALELEKLKTAMAKEQIIIGIDCGEKTGIGIYDRVVQRLLGVHTTDFFGVGDYLTEDFHKEEMRIYVEIPPAFIYARNHAQSGAVRDKHAINIGGNRREAQLLAESLRRGGFSVEEVPPVRQIKWSAEQFQKHLQTDLKSNQHERDAARIAFVYAGRR